MGIVWMLLLGLAFLFFLGFLLYNRIIKNKFLLQEAYSGIEVQLKRRHELIPNLVEVTKGYTGYERKVLEEIVNLRAKSVAASGMNEKVR